MSNLVPSLAAAALSLALGAAPAGAAVLGPDAASCARGSGKPAMLVAVMGLKSRAGLVRVQSYGGDPSTYFAKGAFLRRIEVRPPAHGPVEICVPVPRGGVYAVSVRHRLDEGSRLRDGGGLSGNPDVSLMDALFKRKPSPVQVQVRVQGVTRVPVTMNYVQGTSLKPIAGVED